MTYVKSLTLTLCVMTSAVAAGTTNDGEAATGVAADAGTQPSEAARPVLAVPGQVSVTLPYDARCLGEPEWVQLGQRVATAEAQRGIPVWVVVVVTVVALGAGVAGGYGLAQLK